MIMDRLKILMFISIVMLLSVGCQGGHREVVIGVSQSIDDDWHRQLSSELLSESQFFEGFTLDITSANGDSERQTKQIAKFIDDGVDVIVISPVDSVSVVPIIERAHSLDIPVVVVNRRVKTDKYTSFVGANNYKLGQIVGANIHRKTTARKVLEIGNSDYLDISQIRHNGLLSKLESDVEYLGCYFVADDSQSVEHLVDSLLSVEPNIDLIFGHTDKITHAAYRSAVKAGRSEDITFWGVGAYSIEGGGVDLVSDGILDATYIYSTGAIQILNFAYNYLSGAVFRREISLATPIVDLSRVRILRYQNRGELTKLNKRVISLSDNLSDKTELSNMRLNMLFIAISVLLICGCVIIFIVKLLKHKTDANTKLERQYRELEAVVKKIERVERVEPRSAEVSTTPLESKFLSKFNEIIEQNISNVDFEFDNIGDELCYSRVQVYRKVKALTGESPSKLLRRVRLERADKMLRTTDKPIADIAFEVGFSAPSYFTKSYKDHFGMLPSAVKR